MSQWGGEPPGEPILSDLPTCPSHDLPMSSARQSLALPFRTHSLDVDTRNGLRHNESELHKEGLQMGSGVDRRCRGMTEGLKALAFRYAVFFAFYFWRR